MKTGLTIIFILYGIELFSQLHQKPLILIDGGVAVVNDQLNGSGTFGVSIGAGANYSYMTFGNNLKLDVTLEGKYEALFPSLKSMGANAMTGVHFFFSSSHKFGLGVNYGYLFRNFKNPTSLQFSGVNYWEILITSEEENAFGSFFFGSFKQEQYRYYNGGIRWNMSWRYFKN
jgi:hypothetical protein